MKGEAPAAAKRREELKTAAEHELLKQSNIQTALDALQQSAAQGAVQLFLLIVSVIASIAGTAAASGRCGLAHAVQP